MIDYKLALKRAGILALIGIISYSVIRNYNIKSIKQTNKIDAKPINYENIKNEYDLLDNQVYGIEQRLTITSRIILTKNDINYLKTKLYKDKITLDSLEDLLKTNQIQNQ